jgi:hypothetical protein
MEWCGGLVSDWSGPSRRYATRPRERVGITRESGQGKAQEGKAEG